MASLSTPSSSATTGPVSSSTLVFTVPLAPTLSQAPLFAAPALFQSLAPLSIKLDRTNYSFWHSQVLPAVCAHDLEGFLLGTVPCPPRFIDHTTGGPVPGEVRQLNIGFAL
ncbi:hypothetical protein TorRG33x02_007470 [Trema orientale]|uniref:Retrotransposon Copia-like N-terminal domain-containing protein n=1 Tax=Trema orientale TaxID=63057 RepID=A0A2P5G0J2_TREOI|nr:hypothetical protein TorRG33x02_007470 [Trema orientale]